jgi:hypothetical protein
VISDLEAREDILLFPVGIRGGRRACHNGYEVSPLSAMRSGNDPVTCSNTDVVPNMMI